MAANVGAPTEPSRKRGPPHAGVSEPLRQRIKLLAWETDLTEEDLVCIGAIDREIHACSVRVGELLSAVGHDVGTGIRLFQELRIAQSLAADSVILYRAANPVVVATKKDETNEQ